MNKQKKTEQIKAYVIRQSGGYFIEAITIEDGKVLSSERATEPDVLAITISKLERLVRRQYGI